jgi:hypothetical protein
VIRPSFNSPEVKHVKSYKIDESQLGLWVLPLKQLDQLLYGHGLATQ